MATIRNVIAWADNTQELAGNLMRGVDTVEKMTESAEKMVRSLSGDNLIKGANNAVLAVNQIGGAGKLTVDEMGRVHNSVTKAIEKYTAMGQSAPKAMLDLAAATTLAEKPTSLLHGAMGKLIGVLPMLLGAGVGTFLIGLGKSAFESAGKISDLSGKTGLSTDAIQRMQAVANQTGSSLDAFTSAAFKLGINISEGTTKVRAGITDLGLSYTHLAGLKPEEQFSRVVAALEKQENATERNRIGVALFGKGFAEIAASVAQGYSQIADAAKITGKAQIDALDKAGDAWRKFVDDSFAKSQSMVGAMVLTIQSLKDLKFYDAMTEGLKQSDLASAGLKRRTDDIVLSVGSAKAAARDYSAELTQMRSSIAALSPAQRTQINDAIKVEGITADLADQFGLTEASLRLYQTQTKEASKHTSNLASDLGIVFGEIQFGVRMFIDYNVKLNDFDTNTVKAAGDTNEFNAMIIAQSIALRTNNDALNFGNIAITSFANNYVPLKTAIEQTIPKVEDAATKAKRLADEHKALADGLRNLAQGFATLSQIAGDGGLGDAFKSIGTVIGSMSLGKDASDQWKASLANLKNDVGSTSKSLIQMGVSAISAAAALHQAATSSDNTAVSMLKTAAVGFKVAGVYGAIGGAVYGYIVSEKKAAEQARLLREELAKHHVAINENAAAYRALGFDLDKLQRPADNFISFLIDVSKGRDPIADPFRNVGQTLDDVIAAQKEFEKKLRDTNDAFAPLLQSATDLGVRLPYALLASLEHLREIGVLTGQNATLLDQLTGAAEVDWKKMQEAAEKYGIELSSLGGQFQSARLHESATQIWEDFLLLTKGGADVGGVLFGMREEISALVLDSVKFGTAIPEQFRPLIEELIRSGNLIDANGVAITGLSTQGLTFGDPIVTGFEKIVAKLQELIDKITGPLTTGLGSGIPAAARAAGDGVSNFAGQAVYDLGTVEDAINRVNFGSSPGGLKEIPLLLYKAGISTGLFADDFARVFGVDCVAAIDKTLVKFWQLDESNDRVLLNFDEKWKIGLKTWEDNVGKTVETIIELFGNVKSAIPNEEDMAGIRLGMGDPLQGGIGRGLPTDQLPPLAFASAGAAPATASTVSAARGETVIRNVIVLDGREIARSTARHLPSVVAGQGV